jgi:hypothetical protein
MSFLPVVEYCVVIGVVDPEDGFDPFPNNQSGVGSAVVKAMFVLVH